MCAALLSEFLIDFQMLVFCHLEFSSPLQGSSGLLNLLKQTNEISIFMYALCRYLTSCSTKNVLIHTLFVVIVVKILT